MVYMQRIRTNIGDVVPLRFRLALVLDSLSLGFVDIGDIVPLRVRFTLCIELCALRLVDVGDV